MANLALKGGLVYLKPGKRFAYNEIQDSLGLCIPHRGCTISSTGFHALSAKLGFWIPLIVGWDFGFLELCSEFQNPAFLIPQSNFPRSGFPSTNFPDSQPPRRRPLGFVCHAFISPVTNEPQRTSAGRLPDSRPSIG